MPKPSFAGAVALSGSLVIAAGFLTGFVLTLPASAQDCESPYGPGGASELVRVLDEVDGNQGVSFPTPLKTTGREVSVVTPGEGLPAYPGGYVDFDVNVFLGDNLEYLTGSPYDPLNPLRRAIDPAGDDAFGAVLACATPGSVLAVTTTVEDIFGQIEEDDILQNDSTVVAIVTVHQTYPQSAEGRSHLPRAGMPTVVTTPEGIHGLSFPNAPIPTELVVSVLKEGSGERMQEGDYVTAHFTGAIWNSQEIFSTSFERGIPLSLSLQDLTQIQSGQGVIPGVAQALIGQTVGSRILVSIPPELGYAPGQAPLGVPDGSTLIYVFDILGVTGNSE